MGSLKIIAQKIGVDKAIAYSSGARVIQGFTGVASVFFISTFLTGVEQGFYYTFGSILALQVFFELGLTGIMTQYVAHEASHLTLDEKREYQGEEKYQSRLASLVHFCVKWYSILAILVFVFLLIVGFIYFNKYGESQSEVVEWRLPWIIICIATAIKLFQSPFTSIITGLGFVKETSKISFWQQIILPTFTWLGLAIGFKLYVVGISYLLSVLIWFSFVLKQKLLLVLKNLIAVKVTDRVAYMSEIFPYQWRIALSWVSGYFIFQLFNPVLFATDGAVVAGQMGMTLQALNAISAFSASWLNTKVPFFSKMIALKKYIDLDSQFRKAVKQMLSVSTLLLTFFYVFIWVLRSVDFRIGNTVLGERFLGYLPLLLMVIPVLLQQFISSFATYLRCHKQEPFLIFSIVNGILCLLSTFIFGKLFGLYGVTIGYCLVTIIMTPWAYRIYITKKEQWHK